MKYFYQFSVYREGFFQKLERLVAFSVKHELSCKTCKLLKDLIKLLTYKSGNEEIVDSKYDVI